MTEYLLRLRSGAVVRRQVLNCEPDSLVVSGNHDDVVHWFADGKIATTVFSRTSLHADGFALVAAPNGDSVWLPSAALTYCESDDTVELHELLPAYGTRTRVQWQPATLPDCTDWVQVDVDGDRVFFRRWDETRQGSWGATYCAAACDVLAKKPIEPAEDRLPLGPVPNERALQVLSDDDLVVAGLLARFMHRLLGDAWAGQLHLAADAIRLFARSPTDVEVPDLEAVPQDIAQQTKEPGAIDDHAAASARGSHMQSDCVAEPERRLYDKAATLREIPGPNGECSSGRCEQPAPVRRRPELSSASVVANVYDDRQSTTTSTDPLPQGAEIGFVPGDASLATGERSSEVGNAKQALLAAEGNLQRSAGANSDVAAPPAEEDESRQNPIRPRTPAPTAKEHHSRPDSANEPLQSSANPRRGSPGTMPVSDPRSLSGTQTCVGASDEPGVIRTGNHAAFTGAMEPNASGAWQAVPCSSSNDGPGVAVLKTKAIESQSPVNWESPKTTVVDHLARPQSLERWLAKDRYAVSPQTQGVSLARQRRETERAEGDVRTVISSEARVTKASTRVVRPSAAAKPARSDVVYPHPDASDSLADTSRDSTSRDSTRPDASPLERSRLDLTRPDASPLERSRLDLTRPDTSPLERSRLDSRRCESPRIDSSSRQSSRPGLPVPEGDPVITQAMPAVSVPSRPAPSEAKALDAFAQSDRGDALQPSNSRGVDKPIDNLQTRINVNANAHTSLFLLTKRAPQTRQLAATDLPHSHLTWGSPNSEQPDSSTRKQDAVGLAMGPPRAPKVLSAGMQYRAARQSLEPGIRAPTAAVETRIHAGAPRPCFSIERTTEIGEISVDIGAPESSTARNVTIHAGSLIATIPESRLGARR